VVSEIKAWPLSPYKCYNLYMDILAELNPAQREAVEGFDIMSGED
jgi:hypothetical protein